MRAAALLLAAVLAAPAVAAEADPALKAMVDELERSRSIRIEGLDAPYHIEYVLEDGDSFGVSATLGGIVVTRHNRFRIPQIRLRVGDYSFDNTNYVGSGFTYGSRYDVDRFPLETVYPVLRRYLWLATDTAYKSALEALSRKRAALKNVAATDRLDDFSKAPAVQILEPARRQEFDEAGWTARVRALSAIFDRYPRIKNSSIEFEVLRNIHFLVNSEGSRLQFPESMMFLRARAAAQAEDGMSVRDAEVFHSIEFRNMALEPELRRAITELAERTTALSNAPKGEDYNGPILFEGVAGAQLFAQVLGTNLALTRRPVTEPGRPGAFPVSEFEGRQGSRIMPEFMNVVDDPTQKEWRGRALLGSYRVDREGVAPQPLSVVEKGVLKGFLLTRQPMRGFSASNGHARLPGGFGASAAGIGNLFVHASESMSPADLRRKLIETCKAREKAYGIVVRRLDFPSSASVEELRRLLTGAGQQGSVRPVSPPVTVYKVYTDGREELVRGLRFRGLNTRSLKDILAAGNDDQVFDFLNNTAPFALMGAGGFVAESSVIAPSVLIDDLELHPAEDEQPKLPIVPPPPSGG